MTMNRSLRCALSLASLLFLLSPAGNAQSAFATAPRISSRVDDNVRTRVQGNLTPLARKEYDQGEADSSMQLTHMRLVLNRSDEQKVAFETYLAQLQDKSSPNYHKWLTPEQIGKLYGPADSDVASAVAWLESHGFKVEPISPSHTSIAFSGTVGQAEEAFRTQIHSFSKNGTQFYANITEPSIPTALTVIIKGIAHLNTLQPRSFAHKSTVGTYDHEQKRNVVANAMTKATPELTTSGGFLYIVPGDAATIYDTPNSTFNANFSGGTSYTGSGVTIGIGGDSAIQTSTIVNYRTRYMGDSTSSKLLYTNVDGVAENSDELEAYLDNEVSGGIAPSATLHFYASSDLISGIDQALTDNTVDIFSLSFGACEYYLTTSDNQTLFSLWQNAAAQGIAVTVSTGDSGSAGCDYPTDNSGNNVTDAVEGLQVSGYASTPYNIAVGGTDFAGLPGNLSTYAPTTSSSNYYRSAVSYIPESTWNDSTNLNTTIAKNTPVTGTSANIVAGAGGKSSCSTNTDTTVLGTCTSGYSKPVWQRGSGVSSDGVRDLPDISLMAGDGADGAAWLVCSDDQGTVGSITVTADCAKQSDGNYYFIGVGGTSAAAPAFAGMLALLQQKTGGRLGQAAIELYDLYNASHNSAIFHDINSGNNAVPCTANSPNCAKNSSGYYFESGYDTSTGYDLATGMGSVDATQLINYWGTAVGASTATVTVQPAATSITLAQSLIVAVNVTGTYVGPSGSVEKPTGTVTLTSGSYSSSAQPLSNGTYSFTIPADQLAVGSDSLSVAYSGDPIYATATGTATVTVGEPAGASFTLTAPGVTVTAGASSGNTSAITATGTGGFIGPNTVTLSSCTIDSPPSGAVVPTCTITTPSVTFAAGSSTGSGGLVTINTTAASSVKKASLQPGNSAPWTNFGTVAAAGLLLWGVRRRIRRWRAQLSSLIVIMAFAVLVGCGGGSGSNGGGGNTSAPTVTTGAASSITTSAAAIAGTVNPNGADAQASFLYGTSSTLSGATQTSTQDAGSGTTAANVSANLTGLSAGTKYYYQAKATNSAGSGSGSILSFTTSSPGTTAGPYTFTITGTDLSGITETTKLSVTVN